MQRYTSALIVGFVFAASFAGAQGIPSPATTPPPDVNSPRGVERAPVAPSAQTRADPVVTMTGCVQESSATTVPGAGPAAGTTGATPAEKAAERAGNVPDPHEGPAAKGQQTTTVRGADPAPADTRAGRGASGSTRDGAGANGAKTESSGHKVYFLNNATMAADDGRSRQATGTSGLASPKGYRLEGDYEKIAAQLNRQVRVAGIVQNLPAEAGPVLRVQSIATIAAKCQ